MGEPWDIGVTCDGCDRLCNETEINDQGECIYCGHLIEEPDEPEPISVAMLSYLANASALAWYLDVETTNEHRAAFVSGLGSGFYTFAWWKDGVQYVGSCGTRLRDAMEVLRVEGERLKAGAAGVKP